MKRIMKMKWVVVWLALTFVMRAHGLEYSNRELGFKAKLPDGYEDVSKSVNMEGDLISLGKFTVSDGKRKVTRMVCIHNFGGTLPQEELYKDSVKPANVRMEKAAWKTFQINVAKVSEMSGPDQFINLNAQVPLQPSALQVTVYGPKSEEKALRQELHAILASIKGPSNWLNEGERLPQSGGQGIGRSVGFGVALIVLISKAFKKLTE